MDPAGRTVRTARSCDVSRLRVASIVLLLPRGGRYDVREQRERDGSPATRRELYAARDELRGELRTVRDELGRDIRLAQQDTIQYVKSLSEGLIRSVIGLLDPLKGIPERVTALEAARERLPERVDALEAKVKALETTASRRTRRRTTK